MRLHLNFGILGADGMPLSFAEVQAKARLMWVGEEGRVGMRFAVIEPALFEELQHWSNRKMKEEGWDFPA